MVCLFPHAGVICTHACLRRLVSEQKLAERQKLKIDLSDAHARISLLVKESDERQGALERLNDQQLQSVLNARLYLLC